MSAQHCTVLRTLHTGMKRSEMLGLTWEHVHFDKRKLYVAQQYACDKVPRDPKSKHWIPLDNEIVAYLEEWKRVQRTEFEARKRRLEGEDTDAIAIPQTEKSPVVSNIYGGCYDPNIFGRWFREFCVENGFGEQGRAIMVLILACLAILGNSYPDWNLDDPETAVAIAFLHAFEWAFVRIVPFVIAGTAAGLLLTRRRS